MRLRILRSTIAVVAVTVLFLGLPLMFYTWRSLEDSARSDLQHRLQSASSDVLNRSRSGGDSSPPVDRLRLLVPEGGRIVVDYSGTDSGAGGASRQLAIGPAPDGAVLTERAELGDAGSIRIEQPVEEVRDRQYRALTIEAMVVALALAAGFVVAAITASRVADPVQEVAERARRLADGDFRPDPHRHQIAELDRVLDVLDAATVEIADRLQRERQIVGEVSHQLRSRLTAVHIRLDELTLHPDPNVVEEARAALAQVDRLTAAVSEMVETSRTESVGRSRVDVRAELAPLVADLRPAFERARRRLELTDTAAGTLHVAATPSRLREAVAVLIDNGLAHGRGAVTVTLGSAGASTVVITVSDEGSSIAHGDAQRIFRRGYSSPGSPGVGVGLALARAFVEGDGGRLQLQNRRPTAFAIFLRAADPDWDPTRESRDAPRRDPRADREPEPR